MKNKEVGTYILSVLVVLVGSVLLLLFIVQIKEMIHKNLGYGVIFSTEVASNVIDIEDIQSIKSHDEKIVLFKYLNKTETKPMDSIEYITSKIDFIYRGQKVSITDALLTKDESLNYATLIMDFVINHVAEKIFRLYEIKISNFSYDIQRQYYLGDIIYYSVFLKENDVVKCSLGICFEDRPVLKSFTRDGYVNLCNQSNTPEEFLIENWCRTSQEREKVYKEYFYKSKKIIEETLLLPKVLENVNDVNCVSYFNVSENWSYITLGYVLEDGTYIKMIYNRVNQLWNGYEIGGYHLDFVK